MKKKSKTDDLGGAINVASVSTVISDDDESSELPGWKSTETMAIRKCIGIDVAQARVDDAT